MIRISIIKSNLVDILWGIFEPLVQKAVDHSNGELSCDVIRKRLIDEEMIGAIVYEDGLPIAGVTFEKRDFDNGKSILNITTAGGDKVELWFEEIDKLAEKLAIKYGCSDIYIVGRKGWVKMLKPVGYETAHVVLARKIER